MASCSTFKVSPHLNVLCFRREGCPDPYFVVREFDIKVIRSPSQHKKGRGPSEQAIRASIRQAILNMSLKSERATKIEIRQLKAQGILGKRAPSCSLLNADDMLRLLEAFGKHTCARELRGALKKKDNFSDLPMQVEEVRPRKRRYRSNTTASKRSRTKSDCTRLDALLSALQAAGLPMKPDQDIKTKSMPKTEQVQQDQPEEQDEPVDDNENEERDCEQSDSSLSSENYQNTPEDTHAASPVNLEQSLAKEASIRSKTRSSFGFDSYPRVKAESAIAFLSSQQTSFTYM